MSPEQVPERVRVTSPRTTGTPARVRTAAAEIDALTPVGEVYVASLIRAQLRISLGVLALLVGTVGVLPLLFVLLPGVAHYRLLGVPLPWLVLGLVVYPALLLIARLYVRRAERVEATFGDLLRHPDEQP